MEIVIEATKLRFKAKTKYTSSLFALIIASCFILSRRVNSIHYEKISEKEMTFPPRAPPPAPSPSGSDSASQSPAAGSNKSLRTCIYAAHRYTRLQVSLPVRRTWSISALNLRNSSRMSPRLPCSGSSRIIASSFLFCNGRVIGMDSCGVGEARCGGEKRKEGQDENEEDNLVVEVDADALHVTVVQVLQLLQLLLQPAGKYLLLIHQSTQRNL